LAARDAAPVVGPYRCDGYTPGCPDNVDPCYNDRPLGHCWHESARRRLAWQYGEARASRIALGIDTTTIRDIDAWNRLGRSDRS
jgi:hypothetical protein